MQTNQDALPPDYAVVRGCATDYCNTNLKTHDALPNLSQGELGGVAGEVGGRAGEIGTVLGGTGRGRGLEKRSPLTAGLAVTAQPALPDQSNALNHIYCLLQAPNPQTLSGTECYACLGTHPEDCSPEKSRRVQCHQDQSSCFQGNGRMNIGEGLGWWEGSEGLTAEVPEKHGSLWFCV